jgi:DMSO/TMAO reductase YedYZ molybdopterin-dependent catalytic subunit
MSRRTLIATVGAAAFGAGIMGASQSIGGPLRSLGLLSPRSLKAGDGPNEFQVNKTASAVGIKQADTAASWRLQLNGAGKTMLSREQLLSMPQHTYDLPIACVEGWSTTQSWSGVRLRDLAAAAGTPEAGEVLVESLQGAGALRMATLSSGQIADERSLLALKVNGVDLSLDHGFPARVIVPGAPGVHCTKWVSSMQFTA